MNSLGDAATSTGAALFVPGPSKGVWMPTEYARGPWSPDSLHGGPVAALLTRAAELEPAPDPVRLTRLTVELLRPVPFVPLTVDVTVRRPGRKVSTLDLVLRSVGTDAGAGEAGDGEARGGEARGGDAGGTSSASDRSAAAVVGPDVLALARVQRIRTASIEFPDGVDDSVPEFPDEATEIIQWPGAADVTFHASAVEHRFLRGHFSELGPATDWLRLRVPVVPGEEPSGWQRAAAFADFTNGLSSLVPFDGTSMFINPDLTVHLWREPVGEWICSDAITRTSNSGIGLSQTALWDRTGRIGTGLQSLFLDRFQ